MKNIGKIKHIFMIILFMSMCLFFATSNSAYAANTEKLKNTTRAYFYSEITEEAGCGDCILLENYDQNGAKHYGLIDAGDRKDANGKVVTSVKDFLKKHNVTKLDFFVITHQHSDHNGDALSVLDNYQVDTIYMNLYDKKFVTSQDNPAIYENMIKKAVAKNIKVVGVSYGAIKSRTISPTISDDLLNNTKNAKESNFVEFNKDNTKNISFGSAKIQIFNWEIFDDKGNQLSVKKTGTNKWEYQNSMGTSMRETVTSENNNSLGILLTQGNKKAFFAGDLNNNDKKESSKGLPPRIGDEDRIKDAIGDVDFMKLGHHGNAESNTKDYINVLKPEYVIITNNVGRADKEILDWMKKNNVDYLYNTQDKYEVSATIASDKVYLGVGTENVINRLNNNYYYVPEGGQYKDYKNDLYKVKYKVKNVDVNSWEQLKSAINNNKNNKVSVDDKNKTYTVYELVANLIPGGDWTANSKIVIEPQQKVVLTSKNNITITRGTNLKNEPLFSDNGNLSIGNKDMTGSITIDGNKTKVTSTSALISVELGDLSLYNNVKLCNNFNKTTKMMSKNGSTDYYSAFGSAIFARFGNINMYGGEITDNSQKVAIDFELPEETSRYYNFCTMGAGVYLECASSLNMHGGIIYNNIARNESKIRTNKTYTNAKNNRGIKQQCLGTGVYAYRGSEINLIGGKISNNSAINDSILQMNTSTKSGKTTNVYTANNSIYGVGVCADLSDLNISNDFELSDNKATLGSQITMQKNTKVNNTIASSIRGLNGYIEHGMVNITGGTISGGTAANNSKVSNEGTIGSDGTGSVSTKNLGGGLNLYKCNESNIENLNVTNCKSERGAGLYIATSDVNISNSNISKNTAEQHGGGVFVSDVTSNIKISNTKITNNTANTESGGGIYAYGTLTIDGDNTEISGNTAKRSGGGIRTNSNANVTINGGTITKNTSEGTGGGIHTDCLLTINGGTITGNSSKTNGGGIHYLNGTIVKNGGTITDNTAELEGNNIYPINRSIADEPQNIKVKLSDCRVDGIMPSYYNENGTTLKNLAILDGDKKLVENTDYKVTYNNNKAEGVATVTITGQGNYLGTISKNFRIIKEANVDLSKEYYITSAAAPGRAIDGLDQKGANTVTKTLSCGDTQRFKFIKNDDGSYNIQNVKSNNCLEVTGGKTGTAKTTLTLNTKSNSNAQKWFLGYNSEKKTIRFYTIDGLLLEIGEDKHNAEAQINIISSNNVQRFKLISSTEIGPINIDTTKNYCIVSSINDKKAIDIYAGKKDNFANVDIYDLNRTDAQKFKFEKNSDGSYSIINVGSNKALDVYANKTANQSNVDIYSSNKTNAQKWYAVKNADNTITFLGTESGKAIDLYAASTKNFTNIDIWDWNQTNAQKWKLIQ